MRGARRAFGANRRLAGRLRAVWESMSPPRRVTVTMLVAYLLCAWMAVNDLVRPVVLAPPLMLLGAALVLAGVIIAIPAAWRGIWGAEAPACLVIITGMCVEVCQEVFLAPSPHLSTHVALSVVLLITRVERIWGRLWEPGKGPSWESLDQSVADLRHAQEAEQLAIGRAIAREERTWVAD